MEANIEQLFINLANKIEQRAEYPLYSEIKNIEEAWDTIHSFCYNNKYKCDNF